LYEVVRLLFVAAVCVSFAMVFYVPMERIEKYMYRKWLRHHTDTYAAVMYTLTRIALVLMCCECAICTHTHTRACIAVGLAELIPYLNLFMSLIGSLAGSSVCLICPPLAHVCVLYARTGRVPLKQCVGQAMLIAFGMFAFAVGTYTSVAAIVQTFIDR
jgi:proton-coupled amino acid transporter